MTDWVAGAIVGAFIGMLVAWLILRPRNKVPDNIIIIVPNGTSADKIRKIAYQLIPGCTEELIDMGMASGFIRFYEFKC